MAELTSTERVMLALNRQQPDRVPHFEWLVDKKVRDALCPGCKNHHEFAVQMGHDAILVGPHFGKKQLGPDYFKSEWGFTFMYGREEHGVELEPECPIKSMEDFKNFTPPDLDAPGRYDEIEWAVKNFKGDKAIGVHLNDVFSLPRYLMGMTSLLMAVALEPELVKALVDMSVEYNLEMANRISKMGADFVHTGDDIAYNKGTFMSPKHFEELFYPGFCRVMGGYKDLGFMVIKHTDGNLWGIIDLLVDAGIDCLDPIDPSAGMDLGEVKQKYGQRIALKGNVDCAHLMSFGQPAEVAEATKKALRQGMPGGGYILSSSNSIHASVRPKNYKALLDTLKEYGHYPIS